MEVIMAEAMGLCFGVRDALDKVRQVPSPAQVTIFGQLVHNPLVNRELEDRGFAVAQEATRAGEVIQTPSVLITAHGISNRERAELTGYGKRLIDTTCPLVKRAHDAASTLDSAGYFVIVIGKRRHVEVRGLTGDLQHFAVIEYLHEVTRYAAEKIGIIAQTTAAERDVRQIVECVRAANPHAEVRFINTICRPTRERQAALEGLLEKVDVLVVVGGRQSNNTQQLVARALGAGVRSMHVESAAELAEEMFWPWEIVGLTAGTSTLPETIEAVRVRLERMFALPAMLVTAADTRECELRK